MLAMITGSSRSVAIRYGGPGPGRSGRRARAAGGIGGQAVGRCPGHDRQRLRRAGRGAKTTGGRVIFGCAVFLSVRTEMTPNLGGGSPDRGQRRADEWQALKILWMPYGTIGPGGTWPRLSTPTRRARFARRSSRSGLRSHSTSSRKSASWPTMVTARHVPSSQASTGLSPAVARRRCTRSSRGSSELRAISLR